MNDWSKHLQFFGVVALVSVLIWLYAEGQDVRTAEVSVSIALETPKGFAITAGDNKTIKFTMQGSSEKIALLRQQLASNNTLYLLPNYDPTQVGKSQPINLLKEISNATLSPQLGNDVRPLTSLGITITDVEPASIQVVQDNLVIRSIPASHNLETVKLSHFRAKPATVNLEMPNNTATELASILGSAKATVIIPQTTIESAPRGQIQLLKDVTIELPIELQTNDIKVLTESVNVAIEIERRQSSWAYASVPVWVLAPPRERERYTITISDEFRFLSEVTIIGPSNIIDDFKKNKTLYSVVARIDLSAEDMARSIKTAKISAIEIRRLNSGKPDQTIAVIPIKKNENETLISPMNMQIKEDLPEIPITIERKN